MLLECDSLGLPRDRGERELARDGGGRSSGEDISTSGDVVEGGGTMVASDFWLPDRCLVSIIGGDCGCGCDCDSGGSFDSSFAPFSSASSVISINRRRRSELEEDVIDPEAVWRRQADDRALSFKSEACANGSTVSCGLNLSMTDWNWTLLRARKKGSSG
jgi:hypothetical protein